MLLLGLTGGIATGKSTVSSFLLSQRGSLRGLEVIDADKIAFEVLEVGTAGHRRVVDAFGREVLQADGAIDRALLGRIIFGDDAKRRQLNRITHGLIQTRMIETALVHFLSGCSIAVFDVPLLFESGLDRLMGCTMVVTCSPETEHKRLLERDGHKLTPEDAKQRMASQMPMSNKIARASYVIDNEGPIDRTKCAALDIIKRVMPSRASVIIWWVILSPFAAVSLLLLRAYRFLFQS